MFVRKSLRRAVLVLVVAAALITACSGGAAAEPTVDVGAINTAAVETAMGQLSAQFTQTALAAPTATSISTNTALPLPTFALPTGAAGSPTAVSGALPTVSFNSTATTPLAGFTPLATQVAPAGTKVSLGDSCNNSEYVADVTIPDNTQLKPGEDFFKVWRVKNTGTCTWDDGYALTFIGGDTAIDPVPFKIQQSNDFVIGGATADLGVNLTAPLNEGTYTGTWRMQTDTGVYFGTPLTVVIVVKK